MHSLFSWNHVERAFSHLYLKMKAVTKMSPEAIQWQEQSF